MCDATQACRDACDAPVDANCGSAQPASDPPAAPSARSEHAKRPASAKSACQAPGDRAQRACAPSERPYDVGERPAPLGLVRPRTAAERLSERSQAKARAYGWICKHAGAGKAEAVRQAWLVSMVVAIEGAYRGIILDLNDEQNVLALELHHERSSRAKVRGDAAALAERAAAEGAAAAAAATAADARRRAVEAELALVKGVIAEAEAAAERAAQQCSDLHGAVMNVAAADAAARRRLAVRAHQLREGMLRCRADLHQQRGVARRQRAQIAGAARARRELVTGAADAQGAHACEAEALRAQNKELAAQVEQLRSELAEAQRDAARPSELPASGRVRRERRR